jgi:tetratricopeptide (TPR) repeat protein/CHAT domain-containing protein
MLPAVLALLAALPASWRQEAVDPAIRAAVERFYAAQEAEDIDAYLSLWSKTAQRPRPEQLKYIFEIGDDKFSDLTITRVTQNGDRISVRVSVTRDRTNTAARRPDGSAVVSHAVTLASLTYIREGGELKLLREGSLADGLAEALIGASTIEERARLLEAEPELVGDPLVLSLARTADVWIQGLQYSRALPIYELTRDVAHRIGNARLEGEALQNIGNAMYFLRKYDDALAAYQQRLAIERGAANEPGIASALLGIATVKYSVFEYTEALAAYREALPIQERLKEETGLATTLVSTGNVQYVQADYAGAIADYRRSRDLYRQVGDTTGEARALEGLGRSFAAQGDFAAALESYAGVLSEGRARRNPQMQGTALLSIGEIHLRLGNLDMARPLFEQSRTHFEYLKDLPNVGRVWQAAALTELMSARFPAAEQAYGKSSEACRAAADAECVARAVVGLAFAQSSQERYVAASVTYWKAIDAFTTLRMRGDAARAEVGLSRALLGRKEPDGALAAAGRARQQGLAIGEDDVVWRASVAEARAFRQLGNATSALAAARAAVAAVQRLAENSLDQPGELVAADSVTAYAMLAILQAEAGDAAGAFATAEQRRTHALRVALAANERDIARGMTADERGEERRSAAELRSLRVRLDHERDLPKPDAARMARIAQAIDVATAARRVQQQRLFERLPDLRTWRGFAIPVGSGDVAKALGSDGTIAVEFVIDDEALLAVVAERIGESAAFLAKVTPISRQTLAERIARALDPAALRTVEAWRTASTELVAAIPPDIFARMAAAPRAIVVPDDVLWRVPFEALPVKAGELADGTSVIYAGSVTSLIRTPATSPEPGAVPLLAVGFPELPAAMRERVNATAPGWTLRPPDAAEAEIRGVTAPFSDPAATVLSGAGATEAALRAQAPAASALHLAAPFRMNGASPLFSPLLLAVDPAPRAESGPDAARLDDGLLEAREIMNLDLRARVAVLSDGAATSMRDAAAAAATVRWAWKAAGVPSIVMTRWAGDEAVAAAMLGDFHTRLKAGERPDAALQGARAALRTREETRAPYFWAGWMIIGQ